MQKIRIYSIYAMIAEPSEDLCLWTLVAAAVCAHVKLPGLTGKNLASQGCAALSLRDQPEIFIEHTLEKIFKLI